MRCNRSQNSPFEIFTPVFSQMGFFKRRRRPGVAAAATNGGGGGKHKTPGGNGYSPAGKSGPAGSGTNGGSTYYGFQNVPYAQPGDEAL